MPQRTPSPKNNKFKRDWEIRELEKQRRSEERDRRKHREEHKRIPKDLYPPKSLVR